MTEHYIHKQGLLVKRVLVNTQYRWWAYIPKKDKWCRTTIDTRDKKTLVPYILNG